MKKSICSFLILYLFLLAACKKGDPEIAPINELPALSFGESFISQPLAFNDHMVALVLRNDLANLCCYGEQGNKIWQKSVDQYIITGNTYSDIATVGIEKANLGEIVLHMLNQSQQIENQIVKLIDFDANGNYKWQMQDSIHQPDIINIGTEIIALARNFRIAGIVHLSNGNHMILSSQIDDILACTYLQLSTYNSSGVFVNDTYIKFRGQSEINEVFSTSSNELILYSRMIPNGQSYIMMDLLGNIKFERTTPDPIVENYFFHETNAGIFLISASYIDKSGNFKGIVFTLDKTGNLSWSANSSEAPNWIMMSVQEKADCYIYSGFESSNTIMQNIDWRTTFSQNVYQAVIQKTDLSQKEIWHQLINGTYNTAGAAAIGTDQIGFYSGKFDNTVENIVLLKLDAEGILLNK